MARKSTKAEPAIDMNIKDVISLVDLAARFSKAKGMDNLDYQWLRTAPGRGSSARTVSAR